MFYFFCSSLAGVTIGSSPRWIGADNGVTHWNLNPPPLWDLHPVT
jgi:hypothetical protein